MISCRRLDIIYRYSQATVELETLYRSVLTVSSNLPTYATYSRHTAAYMYGVFAKHASIGTKSRRAASQRWESTHPCRGEPCYALYTRFPHSLACYLACCSVASLVYDYAYMQTALLALQECQHGVGSTDFAEYLHLPGFIGY